MWSRVFLEHSVDTRRDIVAVDNVDLDLSYIHGRHVSGVCGQVSKFVADWQSA